LVDADPNAAAITQCGIGILLCLRCIAPQDGLRMIRSSRLINPYLPSIAHLVEALIALREGQPDAALRHLNSYRIPWGWADPLLRGAIHAQRGETSLAISEYHRAKLAFPDLKSAAREDGRLIWHRDHIEFLLSHCPQAASQRKPARSSLLRQ
jgi:hypothetical protein